MNLLLDTCAVLWLSMGGERVTDHVHELLIQAAHVHLNAITSAELACLQERGRIDLHGHWKPWLRRAVRENGWQVLPADWETVEEAYSLPEPFHRDPADRLIVATARIHRLHILTTDRKILDYPHVDASW